MPRAAVHNLVTDFRDLETLAPGNCFRPASAKAAYKPKKNWMTNAFARSTKNADTSGSTMNASGLGP